MASLVQDPFTFGFLSGILFILALTPLFFWISVWRKDIKSFFRPQKVIHTTKKSPFSVMIQTLWHTLLTVIILLIMAFIIYKFLLPLF